MVPGQGISKKQDITLRIDTLLLFRTRTDITENKTKKKENTLSPVVLNPQGHMRHNI